MYALGIIFYELVTGRRPYTADTPAAVAIMQATDPLPRPKDFIPDLPDEVEKVIFKALAKLPEDRYGSMGLFAQALQSLTVGTLDGDVPKPDDDLPTLHAGQQLALLRTKVEKALETDASTEAIIYRARALVPEFPGLIDLPVWEDRPQLVSCLYPGLPPVLCQKLALTHNRPLHSSAKRFT